MCAPRRNSIRSHHLNYRDNTSHVTYYRARLIFFFHSPKNFKISPKLRYYFIYSNTEVSNFKFAYVRSRIRKYLASLSRDRGLK